MTVLSLLSGVYFSILTTGPGCGYDYAQPAVWSLQFYPNCMDPQVPGLVDKYSPEGILRICVCLHLVILREPLFSRFRFPFIFFMFHRIICPRDLFLNWLPMNSIKSTVFHLSCIYSYSTHMLFFWLIIRMRGP
jgi:hypothetical protein